MIAKTNTFNVPEDAAEFAAEAFKPPTGETIKQVQPVDRAAVAHADHTDNYKRCLAYLAKTDDSIQGNIGSRSLLKASCICVRFDLNETDHRRGLQWYSDNKSDPPWSSKEIEHVIISACKKAGGERGKLLLENSATTRFEPPQKTGHETVENICPLTDAGNGERFARRCDGQAKYDSSFGRWRFYDGQRWVEDEQGRVIQLAKKTARLIHAEAASAPDRAAAKEISKWAHRSESRERLAAMLALARSEPSMTITADGWDAGGWRFNCVNGTIDLTTGELHSHDSNDYITKLSSVTYQPKADAPRWLAFLNRTFDGDVELIEYLQRFHGSALGSDIRDQLLHVYHGQGANGKSTMLDTIGYVMGDYFDAAPPDLLTERRGGDEHPTEVADLRGKRLVVVSESEKGRQLRVQMLKRLTGDATLKARRMRQDYFTFKRTHKLILVTNNRPQITEQTEAVWRRLRLVPFKIVIPKNERDSKLAEKLRAEAPGILRWLVDGCLAWQREGLSEPSAVESATRSYQAESDPLEAFIKECVTLHPDNWTRSSDLRSEYEKFCAESDDRPVCGKDFRDGLRQRGCQPDRRHAGRGWSGIGLLALKSAIP